MLISPGGERTLRATHEKGRGRMTQRMRRIEGEGGECRFELCHWSLFQIQQEIAIALLWHFTQSLLDMNKQLFFCTKYFISGFSVLFPFHSAQEWTYACFLLILFVPLKQKAQEERKGGKTPERKKGGGVELLAAWWVLGLGHWPKISPSSLPEDP